ncbi:MAG: HRDC domain-containing protein [Planctomycetota bacterium]
MSADALFVSDPAVMAEVAAACAAASWIALDTESNSMHAYQEQCCLVQVNAGGVMFVLDPIALGREVFGSIKSSLEDPAKTVWLHGGEYDCAVMRRDFGIQLRGVFDSQQAASMLGFEKTGYGSVVERMLGVQLAKEFSQYNWKTRPIEDGAMAYAIDDVRYLPTAAEQLRTLITEADIVEEVNLANRAVEDSEWGGGFDPGGFYRVKGARELPRPSLPVLAALWAWRDETAKTLDLPPGRVINNETLLSLVRRPVVTFQQLKHVGVKGWLLAQHGVALLDCLKGAIANPPAVPPPVKHRDVEPIEEEREKRLKDWRRSESDRRKVPLQVVLPARALEYLKRYGSADLTVVPQLGAKRIALYGEKLTELAK